VAGEDEVVDPRALEVDGALQARRLDRDTGGFTQHLIAVADGGGGFRRGGGEAAGLLLRDLLALLELGRGLLRGREHGFGERAPAEQHDERQGDREDEVASVVH
jgi:hypothetical protein